MIYTEAWYQHLREDPLPTKSPGPPHVSMSLCPGRGHGSGWRTVSPSFVALFLLSAHPLPPRRVLEGAGPPLSSRKDGPSSYSKDSPSPLPLTLPSWTRGLLFAPLTWPLSQPLTSRVCPLFSQPDDRPHPSTPGCWWSQQPCVPPLTPPAPLVLGFDSASHPLAR